MQQSSRSSKSNKVFQDAVLQYSASKRPSTSLLSVVKNVCIKDDSIQEFKVNVLLPSYDVIEVPYFRSEVFDAKVIDLKIKISELSNGLDPRRMRLLHNYEEMDDNDSLRNLQESGRETLQVVYKMYGFDEEHTQMEYTGFIRSISHENGTFNKSVHDPIKIHFAPNQHGHVVRLTALLDSTAMLHRHDGDMLGHFRGDRKQAADRGFQQWTEQTHLERLLLLEVENDLDVRVDVIRYYTYGVNNGYLGGDCHSWQRYTRKFPVECKYAVKPLHEDEDGGEEHFVVSMQPYEALKYSTYYAVLLMNNVPTVPVGSVSAPWTAFTVGGTNEDKLFIFKTEKRPDLAV